MDALTGKNTEDLLDILVLKKIINFDPDTYLYSL